MNINEIIKLPLVSVDLTDIGNQPGPYCMSFGFNLDPLIKSIKSVGLINSPILVTNIQGKLDIVTGYRRIMAAKSLSFDQLQCRIISESDIAPLGCLLLNLHDNLTTRKLNEVEKGMVFGRLKNLVPKHKIIESYMQLLSLPSNEGTYKRFIRLDEELDQNMKQYVAKGQISFQSAERILDIELDLRSYVFDLLLKLTFNINQQTQLLEYFSDIINSKRYSIIDLLNRPEFKKIYSNEQMNNPQKAKAILQFFREIRFPMLVQAEKEFKDKISSLHLLEGIRISYPPFFEGPSYRMEVFFKNGKELKKKIEQISKIRGLEDVKDPWKREA